MNVWISSDFTNIDTSFTMALYSGSTTSPDVSNELLSQNVTVIDTGIGDRFDNQWQGVSGLDLELSEGIYWLSLEMREGNNYSGYIPTVEYGALNSVGTYAYSGHPATAPWFLDPRSDFAFTISGDVSPVPVPAALWLFCSGLSGLLAVARSRRRDY